MYLADIKRDDRFEGYLIVRSAEQRASANGKNYLDMTLADKSGSINAKMWDGTVQPPLAGSIVKVRATGNEFNGRMQLRVEKIRAAESRDAVDMIHAHPLAPHATRRKCSTKSSARRITSPIRICAKSPASCWTARATSC